VCCVQDVLRATDVVPDTDNTDEFEIEFERLSLTQEDSLIRAAAQGRLRRVTLLLVAHADVNVRDHTQGTALIAASCNGHVKVVEELLKFKADSDLQDERGRTALIFSVENDHMEICALLLRAGAAVNMQDKRGNSALTMASYFGYISICHLLVKCTGVDIDIKNGDGRTPLMMACYPPEVETSCLNAKTEICVLLIGLSSSSSSSSSS